MAIRPSAQRSVVLHTVLALSAASALRGATIRVPQDQPTIQQGINAAGYGDTVLVAPGIYYEHLLIDQDDDGVTLVSEAGAESTAIDGNDQLGPPLVRAENVGPPTAIVGFALRNNRVMTGGGSRGGGIRCDSAGLRIEENIIEACQTRYSGGGLYALNSSDLVIAGNTIRGNRTGEGGGIHLEGCSASVIDNVIAGNEAAGWFSYWGGGLSIVGGETVLHYNLVTGNTAGSSGGGVYVAGSADATVEGNLIDSNSAVTGSALYISDATVTAQRNVLVGNRAELPDRGCVWFTASGEAGPNSGARTFVDNIVAGNVGTAFVIVAGQLPSIVGSSIDGNGHLVVEARAEAQAGTVNMAGNWWGTADPNSIANLIYDCHDNPNVDSCVDFSAYCSDPSCSGQVTSVPDEGLTLPVSWGRLKVEFK